MAVLTRAQTISQTSKKLETYSDFSTAFSKHPITNELITIRNEDSVRQAFKNLILTNIGERLFNPFFGSNVTKSLFENYSPFVREDIVRYITNSAKQFENRIQILQINIADLTDKNALQVDVIFSLINTPTPINLSLFLKRVR